MAHTVHDHAGVTMPADDCWSRIDTCGDQSCPYLVTYSCHLNCPIPEEKAVTLLDRVPSDADLEAAAQAHRTTVPPWTLEYASVELIMLVFHTADEWFVLPAVALRQIDIPRAIHTLLHRRNRVVLGLVSIRGALTAAVLLDELLGLDRMGSKYTGRNGYARLLVAAHHDEPAVFPMDEVEGVLRFPATALLPVPFTFMHITTAHARGVLVWCDVIIDLSDIDRMSDSVAQSL